MCYFSLKHRRKRCFTFWWNMAFAVVKQQTLDWRWMDWPFTLTILTSYSGLENSLLPDVLVWPTSHSHGNKDTHLWPVSALTQAYLHILTHSQRWIWIWECNRKSCHCNILLILYKDNLQSSVSFLCSHLIKQCCFSLKKKIIINYWFIVITNIVFTIYTEEHVLLIFQSRTSVFKPHWGALKRSAL